MRAHRPFLLVPALVLALGVAACHDAPAGSDKPAFAPEALAPIGPTNWPITFTWKSVPGTWIYRVTVIDPAERVLYERETRDGDHLQPRDELHGSLTGNATFTWHVAIIGDDGKALVRSKDLSFTLK